MNIKQIESIIENQIGYLVNGYGIDEIESVDIDKENNQIEIIINGVYAINFELETDLSQEQLYGLCVQLLN